MSDRTEELQARLQRLRAFGSLRRDLRVLEDVEAIAAAVESFARDVLRCEVFAVYAADDDAKDFSRLAPAADGPALPLPEIVERVSVAELEKTASMPFPRVDVPGREVVAFALRSSPEQLIGVAIVVGTELDAELLEELVFDVESTIAARMIARLRAEELAVLEIQERELVGLLRDVEARDAIIQRDLEEARQFQRKMLGAPPRVPNVSIEVVYQPLGLVGGDLYAVSLDGNRLRLFIADATGHGVRASLTTMFIKSGYEAVRSSAPDPATLLAKLNDTIAQTYRSSEMLFSAACVDVDLTLGHVVMSSAAHPAICVVNRKVATFVEGAGAFLGLRKGLRFRNQEAHLEEGDGVYLYTDGFVEARKQQNKLFGDERLERAILDAHIAGQRAGDAVVAAVNTFLEGTPLDDDGTFLGAVYGVEDSTPPASVR